jgi:hypothetical protein
MQKTLLLCTFTTIEKLEEIVNQIDDTYDLAFDSIYVLKNVDNENQLILTYNIIGDHQKLKDAPENTISVHRKKHTNTIYTINAINKLIIQKIGRLDTTYNIDWKELENCVLVTAYGTLKKIHTKIHKIIKLD